MSEEVCCNAVNLGAADVVYLSSALSLFGCDYCVNVPILRLDRPGLDAQPEGKNSAFGSRASKSPSSSPPENNNHLNPGSTEARHA